MLYLLDSQEEHINAFVIAAFEITDERGHLVATANSESDARMKMKMLLDQYPEHRFYIVR